MGGIGSLKLDALANDYDSWKGRDYRSQSADQCTHPIVIRLLS